MPRVHLIRELENRRAGRTWKQLAAEIGCGASYLCDVLKGNRKPGKLILDYLGLEARIVYKKIKDEVKR